MLKRVALISLALVMVLSMVSMASARPNIAENSKKGSLLVFPKIAVFPGGETVGVDTYIFIGNDSTQPTYVKCYWMDQNQSIEDFHFYLTANQPVAFSASEGSEYVGPPFSDNAVGSLVCWAQDEKDQNPAKFNHLYGYAMIQGPDGNVFYNAFAFALPGTPPVYVEGSDTVNLLLNGGTYDMCPKYLVTNFITGFDSTLIPNTKPDLTLWPCRQDLRQDRIPTCTKAKFDIWNEHEVKFTGAYQCFKCFFEGFLDQIGDKTGYLYSRGPGFGGEKFTGDTLRTATARLRVQGVRSTVCDGNIAGTSNPKTKGCAGVNSVNTPLLGVLLYGTDVSAPPSSIYISPQAGHALMGAGYDDSGFISWNPASTVVEKKNR